MAVRRGDIVLAHIYFSSGGTGKVRPALVVQSDHNNQRLQDTIVAVITRTTHRAHLEATQLLIDLTTAAGRQSGLLHTLAVKCEHLATVLQADIHRTIGALPASIMQQIDGCLRASLGLP